MFKIFGVERKDVEMIARIESVVESHFVREDLCSVDEVAERRRTLEPSPAGVEEVLQNGESAGR